MASLLYGISSVPEEGTFLAAKVLTFTLIGVVLIAIFLAVSAVTMFLFAAAFFGALLLVPAYFQQVNGYSVLKAGLLVAPQGIGAMITMPVAGTLVDRVPVGRIVLVGLIAILAGMGGLAYTPAPDTSDWTVMGWLFVAGLGADATMMPLFTAAMKTLRAAEVARGSTLLNVTQQVASASGIAVISVVLTNLMKSGLTPAQLAAVSNTDQGRELPQSLRVSAEACSMVSSIFWRTPSRTDTG